MEMVADPVIQPVCSICIANFNGMGVIDACLQSVLFQDCDFSIEIIVHDDASTDESVEFIRANYPSVKLIASEQNVGFCISNNRMVEVACGKFILLLNNDAELFPDAVRVLHEEASKIGTPAILGLPQYNAATGKLIDRGSLFDPFLNPIPNLDQNRTDVGMIIGACLWIPKVLWVEIGGFPEWFHTLAEDMYLCCLARLYGAKVHVVQSSGFRHWVGKSLGGGKIQQNRLVTSARRRILSERNKSYVMMLSYPAPLFQLIFPVHLLFLLLEGFAVSILTIKLSLFWKIYWFCLKSLWLERSRLWYLRRLIQDKKRIGWETYFEVFMWLPYKLKMLIRHGIPEVR